MDVPALNKRALKKTIRYRMVKANKAVTTVNGAFADADAYRPGDQISQDGGLYIS